MFPKRTRNRCLAVIFTASLAALPAALAEQLIWSPVCDTIWQTCCDGPSNTMVNNWGRSAPEPLCPSLPTGADDLVIVGDCTIGASPLAAVAALTIDQSGGTFELNHALGVADFAVFDGPLVWNSGEIGRGTGANGQYAELNGGLTIQGSADRTLSTFGGFTLINNASATWTGVGNLTIGMIPGGCCPSILENAAGATFTVQNDSSILQTAYGVGVINNAGTLRKSGSTGISEWAVNLNNTGQVHVETGELRLTRAGAIAGDWLIDPNAQLSFAGNFFELDPNVTIQGRAVVMMSGTNPGIVVDNDVTIDDLTVADDGKLGGSGILRIAGTLTVEGGDPSVHINVLPGGQIESSGTAGFYGQLDVQGAMHILSGGNAGCFNQLCTVLAGGEIVLDNDAVYNQTGLVSQPLECYGTIRKVAGLGTARVANFFSQNLNTHPGSSIRCPEGELRIENRVDCAGTNFDTGPDAEIGIYGWSTFRAGTTVTGNGWLRVEAQNTSIEDGFEMVVPRLRLSGDSSRGVNGPGNLRIQHELEITGGFTSATTTTIDPNATANVLGPGFSFSNTNLDNFGTVNLIDSGMRFTTLTNHPGATVDLQGEGLLGWDNGGNAIANNGVILKSTQDVESVLGGRISNYNQVEVQTGRLRTTHLDQYDGLTWLNGGDLQALTVTLNGGELVGTGEVTANSVTNNGATINPGDSAGTMSIVGSFSQAAGGTLQIELGGLKPGGEHDQVCVSSMATMGGTLKLLPISGFIPQVGQQFTVLTRSGGSGQFANVIGVGGGSYFVTYNTTEIVVTVAESPCPGDLDHDGYVGLSDLAQLLAHYDTPSGATYEDGDLDGDGDVDLSDLAALLAVYETACP